MKGAIVLVAAAAGATTLQAQAAPAAAPGAGAPAAPAGWVARFDRANSDPTKVRFVTMGQGLHFTTGPSATWYRPGEVLDGEYAVQATFVQTKKAEHNDAYGLMVFGREMDRPTQNYVYFMVRQTGEWSAKHRANDTEVHTVQGWVAHPAIVKGDAAGKAVNTLRVQVDADSARFMINGQQVMGMDRKYLKDVSGVPGIRMNHGLDVHVDGWSAERRKP